MPRWLILDQPALAYAGTLLLPEVFHQRRQQPAGADCILLIPICTDPGFIPAGNTGPGVRVKQDSSKQKRWLARGTGGCIAIRQMGRW